MKSKTIIFVLVPIQKVIFCMSQFEGLSTLKMLTTDSLGNVRAIEKVAMFKRIWSRRPLNVQQTKYLLF